MSINNPATLSIALNLQGYEATQLASALRAHLRRQRNKIDPAFTPIPGRVDINLARVQTCQSLLDRLTAAIEQQLQEDRP